jgi:phenylacetate-CoA ligase
VSLATRIYERLPVFAQDLAVSLYGVKLERTRYGRRHAEVLKELERSQWLSHEAVNTAVRQRLDATLRSAVRDVPWYADQGWRLAGSVEPEMLLRLPILTKHQLQDHADAFLSRRLSSSPLESVYTGGTTGRPLRILATAETLQTNYAFFMRFRGWAGARGRARTATFAGRTVVPFSSGPPLWRRNRARNTWLFSSYHLSPATVAHYVRGLTECAPEIIDTYPSSIEPIARYMLEHEVDTVRPKAVITSSETLFPRTRAVIEAAFGCRVFDHYGSAEMAAFITQCEHGRYHVNPEFGIVEILRDGLPVPLGESGEIVATGFINPAMPLVRYATGDLASLSADKECPCGRAFPIIDRIEGRMDDVILTPDGRRIGRLDPIFKSMRGIHEARIVQEQLDLLTLQYVPTSEFVESDLEPLLTALRARVGDEMFIRPHALDKLERTARGKLQMVVSRIASDHPGGGV